MKKTYKSPVVKTIVLSTVDGMLVDISNAKVIEENGGWVKDNSNNSTSSSRDNYNVWDDDWSK